MINQLDTYIARRLADDDTPRHENHTLFDFIYSVNVFVHHFWCADEVFNPLAPEFSLKF